MEETGGCSYESLSAPELSVSVSCWRGGMARLVSQRRVCLVMFLHVAKRPESGCTARSKVDRRVGIQI